jgi:hypothetical protein
MKQVGWDGWRFLCQGPALSSPGGIWSTHAEAQIFRKVSEHLNRKRGQNPNSLEKGKPKAGWRDSRVQRGGWRPQDLTGLSCHCRTWWAAFPPAAPHPTSGCWRLSAQELFPRQTLFLSVADPLLYDLDVYLLALREREGKKCTGSKHSV